VIHETAVVDRPCTIGEGTRIWHFAHVMRGAKIGRHCVLGQGVHVASGAVVGDRVRIQNHVSIYAGVTVEDDVFLGPSCVFTNVKHPRATIDRRSELSPIVVRRGATIGANATIVCGDHPAGLTIGRHAFVGAGAVVTRDVPDYALVVGGPGRRVGWVGRHGARLVFEGEIAVCPISGLRYLLQDDRVRGLDLDDDAPHPEPRTS
jgi:UDP-2-acetamido-3-amino-2,3-dideoxy-glucuronate N-acetyltransferase